MKDKQLKLNPNRLALTLGIFIGGMHTLWALIVGLNLGQRVTDWIFPMHFLNNLYTVYEFNWITAIMLTVMAFICSYICGWIFAWVYNKLDF